MSSAPEEAPITARQSERPSLKLQDIRRVKPRDLGYRFIAGALTSIVAGVLTLVFGVRAGGLLLAFPAILGASLTLIEEQEDGAEAREDARGAVMGGLALGMFALVAALALGKLSTGLALLLATVTWFAVAFTGYLIAWFR